MPSTYEDRQSTPQKKGPGLQEILFHKNTFLITWLLLFVFIFAKFVL